MTRPSRSLPVIVLLHLKRATVLRFPLDGDLTVGTTNPVHKTPSIILAVSSIPIRRAVVYNSKKFFIVKNGEILELPCMQPKISSIKPLIGQ